MPDTSGEEPGRTRPFADVLVEHDKGRTHAELSAKLQDLIASVLDTQKGGTLTLSVKVTPDKADGMVRVGAGITVKLPARARESLFYVDDENNLTRNDPRQTALASNAIAAARAEREAAGR